MQSDAMIVYLALTGDFIYLDFSFCTTLRINAFSPSDGVKKQIFSIMFPWKPLMRQVHRSAKRTSTSGLYLLALHQKKFMKLSNPSPARLAKHFPAADAD
jgi:hypothetical protein